MDKNLNYSKVQLSKKSIVKRVLDDIRTDIVQNKIKSGTRLVEEELSATYNASRGTIRAALRELSSDGFIEYIANGGCVVSTIDEKTIRDTYKLRMLLELEAANIILSSDQICYSPLVEALDLYTERESSELYHSNPLVYFVNLDIEIHYALVAISQNKPLQRSWLSMSAFIRDILIMRQDEAAAERYIRTFYDEHKKLVQYAITKDERLLDVIRALMTDLV